MDSFAKKAENHTFKVVARIVASALGILICVAFMVSSARFGLSKLVGHYAVLGASIPAAAEAVRLAPLDADAHRALAICFRDVQMNREAEREWELATSLRPSDDLLWLELGSSRDDLGDQDSALKAFDQAVMRAPYYAHTVWERGNLRLRMGRYDEAFAELRAAAKSNRAFLPTLIDLAWSLSGEDSNATQQLAGIDSPEARVAFARFLARKGRGPETVVQFRLAQPFFADGQRRELIRTLMSHAAYLDAYAIWDDKNSQDVHANPAVFDGGFEGTLMYGEVGFGWIIPRVQTNVDVSVDTVEKEAGTKSIRVVYKGDSPATEPVISQTIIVKPLQKYRINFAVKTKGIVTGGLPSLAVFDATTETVLAKSPGLPQDSGSWQRLFIEFTPSASCGAIVLKLERNPCQENPCPIFGSLWLDSVSIEPVGV